MQSYLLCLEYVLVICTLKLVSGQITTPDGCFEQWTNYKHICDKSFERRSGLRQEQCQQMCFDFPSCKSVQYKVQKQQCDLFTRFISPGSAGLLAQSNIRFSVRKIQSAGSFHKRAKRHGQFHNFHETGTQFHNSHKNGVHGVHRHSSGHHHYGGGCNHHGGQVVVSPPAPPRPSPSNRPNPISCYGGPRVIPCPDAIYWRPTGLCGGQGPGPPPTPPRPTPPFPTAPPPTFPPPTPPYPTAPPPPITTPGPPLPIGTVCPSGQSVRFIQIDGVRLAGSTGGRSAFQATSLEQCIAACADNRFPNRQEVPCLSANYDKNTGSCSLSSDALQPMGSGFPEDADGSVYLEKLCIDQTLADSCPGPYIRQPQRILVGFAESVVDATDLPDCLLQCLQAIELFGFPCNSGMHFADEPTLNCVLNTESAMSQPNYFTEENSDVVDYFELGCGPQFSPGSMADSGNLGSSVLLAVNSSNWSRWTVCNPRIQTQSRFRSCTRPTNPTSCKKETKRCGQTSFADSPSTIAAAPRKNICSPMRDCCPLLLSDGSKDCERGITLTSGKRAMCRPKNCQ